MLPKAVERTMQAWCSSLQENSVNLDSVYLYGSVALGDYVEGSSDIDFIAILRKPASEEDIRAIVKAHEKVESEFPNTDMMGAYLLLDDLGKPYHAIPSILTYYNRQVHTNGQGADLNPITWWILKKYGVRIYGSEITFTYDVAVDDLVRYVVGNLNSYWVSWIHRLEHQLLSIDGSNQGQERVSEQLDEAVEWCTLGMLRQLYTIREHDIKSKVEAGYYGITVIPPQWHALIDEAIHIKRRRPERIYTSNVKRLTDLVALLRYIHLEANEYFDKGIRV